MKKFFKFEVEEEEMKAGIQAVRDETRRDETRRDNTLLLCLPACLSNS
jgi:hypothetical protein